MIKSLAIFLVALFSFTGVALAQNLPDKLPENRPTIIPGKITCHHDKAFQKYYIERLGLKLYAWKLYPDENAISVLWTSQKEDAMFFGFVYSAGVCIVGSEKDFNSINSKYALKDRERQPKENPPKLKK
jgi:hypothetical protein